MLSRIFKIFRILVLSVIGLVVLIAVLVNLTPVQNFAARQAAQVLANKLQTKVSVGHIRIDFLNHVLLQDLYLQDKQGDTVLSAGEVRVRISDWFIIRKDKPVIRYVGLHHAYVHLYRTRQSDKWNYQFIIDAFDTGKKDTTKKQNEFELDLEKLDLQQVRFHMDDAWVGNDMDLDVGSLQLDAKEVDIKKKLIDINELSIEGLRFAMRDYEGGRPAKPKDTTVKLIDTTAFNPARWVVRAGSLQLKDCAYTLDKDDVEPTAFQFDPEHISVRDINLDVHKLSINGDTLKLRLENLSAKERSGLIVKKMQADVSVSPNASIGDNLFLQTNNSTLRRYYAMHYQRFPDFKEYIDKVVMVGDFQNASIDARDVAYFAPALKQFSATTLKMNGKVGGTVDSLIGKGLDISDGQNKIRGDLSVIGLPNIDTTLFTFNKGAIYTSGAGILKYAPVLKGNPNFAVEKLRYVLYTGNFRGYINSFAANGTLATNLGTIRSDVTLKLVGKGAVYSGDVSTTGFDLGTLIRQPLLGGIALQSNVKGTTTDPKNPFLSMDGKIPSIVFNGYRYQNIEVNGLLDGKTFTGRAIVDDPNLAFAFYGGVNFLDNHLAVNANANLLHSNLKAINLIKDSIDLSADFNVDFTGNTIDDFLGYARLYNINMLRDGHHLDIDSIFLTSALDGTEKLLTLESNNVSANVRGNFELSTLPYSFQYYIAGYLPNYITTPDKYAPNQSLTFDVTTRELDSMWLVLLPNINGFNHAHVEGSLKTNEQQLTLNASIPEGHIGNIHLRNVGIKGDGNFKALKLEGSVENISVGDDVLSASMAVNTTLGNDSLSFNIDTKSADAIGTASLNGTAYARADSLFLSVAPSSFLLNDSRWEIPDGSSIVISDSYLRIRDFTMQNGKQKLLFSTAEENTLQSLLVQIQALDIAQLGGIAGLGGYEPKGRVDGNVRLDSLFSGIRISSDVSATEVMLGTDTIGTIKVDGQYVVKTKTLSLNPGSGISRGVASLRAAGSVSFDTLKPQLAGYVQFNDASVAWLTPFVSGLLSEMSGTINGTVNFGGSPSRPDVSGNVSLLNAGMRVNIIGSRYRIPSAVIKLDNNSIDFGTVRLLDDYNNEATLTGGIAHNRLQDMRFDQVSLRAPKLEVINLQDNESAVFYGNLIANVENLTVTGTFDDIRLSVTAAPVAKSHIYIPIKTGGDVSSYSYVSFVNYDTIPEVAKKKARSNKFSLNIVGKMNPFADITMILDPSTGDAINAAGYGNITLSLTPNEGFKMYGNYDIDEGDYTFTFKQLFFRRKFEIEEGSRISFYGPIESTSLNVDALYTTRARLYDALDAGQRTALEANASDVAEAKRSQSIDVKLKMTGSLSEPKFSYQLALPSSSQASLALQIMKQINQNDAEVFNQVAALLLFNSFIPQSGGLGNGTATGALVNNVSDILSSTASSQLTNLASKLLGDPNLSIDLKYKNYNLSDPTISGGINRNEVSFGVRKNLLDDRLIIELGSAYDWGRPANANSGTSNLNFAGDFRVQYLLTEDGRIRLNAFRSSNYDVLTDKPISRGGVGITYRKSFNTFDELFSGRKNVRPSVIPITPPAPSSDTGVKSNSGVTKLPPSTEG